MLDNIKKKVAVAMCAVIALCAVTAAVWFVVRGQHPTRESLLAIACDPTRGQQARGQAVSRLFADYVKPNATAAEVHEALGDCDWIAETRIIQLDYQSGDGHPLWVREVGTLYHLDLFVPEGRSDWRVYARFSGIFHTVSEVKRFFDPHAESDPQMRLVEFALNIGETGKWEVFDATGRHPPKDD